MNVLTIETTMIKSAILVCTMKTAYWAASEKNVVISSFTYSVLYCFLFGKKKQDFINCSVSGNRKPGNSSWIYMRFWVGCQVWFNSRRPFRNGPAMSTRDKMKPPTIKVMHILFTFVLLCWNSLLFPALSAKEVWQVCVCVCLSVRVCQGYANTEESLGKSVLLISDMSDVAPDMFPSKVKLKAALRLLFTKHPAWVWALGLSYLIVGVCLKIVTVPRCAHVLLFDGMCSLMFLWIRRTPESLNVLPQGHITIVCHCQVMLPSLQLNAPRPVEDSDSLPVYEYW